MHFAPIDIPDELLDAQEQDKLVVFAGAGVSMGGPSNLPSFKGLAAEIAGSHPLAGEIDRFDNRLDRFLGELSRSKVDVQGLCRSRISDSKSKPTELHRSLVDLFSKPEHVRIVTTNFDNHFRVALGGRGWKTDCYHAPALPLGHQFSGVVYGSTPTEQAVIEKMKAWRKERKSFAEIANALNGEGIPPRAGGEAKWHATQVVRVLKRSA